MRDTTIKKVIVFEFNPFHTEIFPMYEHFLPILLKQDKLDIHYQVSYPAYKRIAASIGNLSVFTGKRLYLALKISGLINLYQHWLAKKIIRSEKPDVIVLNSIEPRANYQFAKSLSKQSAVSLVAIVHNPGRNFDFHSLRQRRVNLFSLSDIVYHRYRHQLTGYLLPYFQPSLSASPGVESRKVVVGVQGKIDNRRRDYPLLLELANRLAELGFDQCVFNIIGTQQSNAFKNSVLEKSLSDYFIFHDALNDEQFLGQIAACDYLMPLIGEKQSDYLLDKTTATFSHSAAFGKPMILSRQNATAWQLDETVALIYESLADLVTLIQQLKKQSPVTANYRVFIQNKIMRNEQQLALLQ